MTLLYNISIVWYHVDITEYIIVVLFMFIVVYLLLMVDSLWQITTVIVSRIKLW